MRHIASQCFLLLCGLLIGCAGQRLAIGHAAAPVAAARAGTAAEALALVKAYVAQQADQSSYLFDQANVGEEAYSKGRTWFVAVPRADRIHAVSNGAAFRVQKASGAVTRILLK